LTKLPEGDGEQVLANVVVEGEPPVAVMPAAGFASRVVRVLRGGRCGVGDRTAVPAISLAVVVQYPYRRSPQRHQPVLRVVYAGSGYPATIARRMVAENMCADAIELDTDHTPSCR